MDNKWLTIVQQHEEANDLVFVKPEDLQTQRMFVPQVTVIHATPEDFHNIQGKMMPKSYHTDRIGEAAGIHFIAEHCGTRKEGEFVWVGYAQGRRRLPDGTWRASSKQEYEFDAELRAEIDEKSMRTPKEKLLLDYRKFGRQRASTGARMRVIRELTGIPTAFTKADMQRALVIHRIAVNTDELLENPETRNMVVTAAINSTEEVYGPAEEPVVQRMQLEAPEEEFVEDASAVGEFGEEEQEKDQEQEPDDHADLFMELERFKRSKSVQDYKPEKGRSPLQAIDGVLNAEPFDPLVAAELLERLRTRFEKKEGAE